MNPLSESAGHPRRRPVCDLTDLVVGAEKPSAGVGGRSKALANGRKDGTFIRRMLNKITDME